MLQCHYTMQNAPALSAYLNEVSKEHQTGHAREHSYRPALKAVFEAVTGFRVVNEPTASAHGQPDFIFLKSDLPVCWAEAKDINANLDKVEKSEQMGRYYGYSNLILTNELEFRFYKNGIAYGEPIVLATLSSEGIAPNPDAFEMFLRRCEDFIVDPIDTIRSAKHLAQIMGGKARRLRQNVLLMLDPNYDSDKKGKEDIAGIMEVLKKQLIHDLTHEQFADIYAQTLTYGLFVARYHDDTKDDFTRSEARDRIPASNHLLQQFFDHIAGANFVFKLSHIVDELCDVFVHADVHALVHGLYQKKGDSRDPIIHFYEDFLKEYDPALRKQRGVFYTPLPVVKYIVRSVDKILQTHFDLPEGLADRAQIDWTFEEQGKKSKKQIDAVQILDPAVGTGTFLHEVIQEIYAKFKGQEGIWSQYVSDHLLPRLHGFELMMASYTIAHLKLSMSLKETGAETSDKRLRVFLTNSLEEAPKKDDTLFKFIGFQEAVTEEAERAAEVKRDMPIMVVMGNPPYSASSSNKGEWINDLIKTYKEGLKEKSYNALSDDYVKFIRFAHHLIEKNGQGIVAMITNNSFLDGLVHRIMRKSLLKTFDDVYVLDLHGSTKKKEVCPDGSKDENVFDIQQGVSISIFVKSSTKKKSSLGKLHHYDVYGTRKVKYEWLENHNVSNTDWIELDAPEPNSFFIPKDFGLEAEYMHGLLITSLFPKNISGIQTKRDDLFIDNDVEILKERIITLLSRKYDQEFIEKYNVKDSSGYDFLNRLKSAQYNPGNLTKVLYKSFDTRNIYYDEKLLGRSFYKVMKHMLHGDNYAYCLMRSTVNTQSFNTVFVSKSLIDLNFYGFQTYLFPIYLYPDSSTITDQNRIANLNMKLLQPVLDALGFAWTEDGTGNGKDTCGPEDIFDYIYAILHSPTYRKRYKEFLKIDFPRVPFTKDKTVFWKLVSLGRELRRLHLMESPKLGTLITAYPVSGSNEVEKPVFEDGKVWINKEQYFDSVPKEAWEFPIGGYLPAQKWLKDRKGRVLNSDDILHYQKMIVALVETGKLMEEVNETIEANGGWPIK